MTILPSHVEKERWEVANEEGRFHFGVFSRYINSFNERHEILRPATNLLHESTDQTESSESFLLNHRNNDVERRASHADAIQWIGRMNGYKEIIDKKKEIHRDKKKGLVEALKHHAKCRQQKSVLEAKIDLIETELSEATSRLESAPIARKKYHEAVEKLYNETKREKKLLMKMSILQNKFTSTKREACQIRVTNKAYLHRQLVKGSNIPALQERARILRQWAHEHREALDSATMSLIATQLKKRKFVLTRFGPRKKLFLRQNDMMFCVELFRYHCHVTHKNINVTMYVPFAECLRRENILREESRSWMEKEENFVRFFNDVRKSHQINEFVAMSGEEILQRYNHEYNSITSMNTKIYTQYQSLAMKLARKKLRTKKYRERVYHKTQKVLFNKSQMDEGHSDINDIPVIIRYWRQFSLKWKIYNVEKRKMLQETSLECFEMGGFYERLKKEREIRVTKSIGDDVLQESVMQALVDIVENERNIDASMLRMIKNKEKITFSKRESLDFKSYLFLLQIWQERKKSLRSQLKGTKYDKPEKLQARSLEEIKTEIERRMKLQKEQYQIQMECALMLSEDTFCKEIHQKELKSSLGERRSMEGEEKERKLFIEGMKIFQESKKKSKKNMYEPKSNYIPSTKEFRRSQLKQEAARRQREQKEAFYMEAEDNLAVVYHEEERKQKHLEMLQSERNLFMDSTYPNGSMGLDPNSPNVQTMDIVYVVEEEDESNYRDASLEILSLELDWMEREEDARLCEDQFNQIVYEMKKMELTTIDQCKKELRTLRSLNNLQKSIEKFQMEKENISKNIKKYLEQKTNKQKNLITAEFNEKWMDSSIVTNVTQRWPTKALKRELHTLYFKQLTNLLLLKVACDPLRDEMEKKTESIQHTKSEIREKREKLRSLRNRFIRRELLNLHRSKLGQKFFRKTRQDIILKAFKCWVRFVSLRCTSSNFFMLKEASLNMKSAMNSYFDTKQNIKCITSRSIHDVPTTILDRNACRSIQCRRCDSNYDECRNHSIACLFHPGKYSKGEHPNTSSSMWSCCQNELYSTTGCKSGYHLPPLEGYSLYSKRLKLLEEQDENVKELTIGILDKTKHVMHEGTVLSYLSHLLSLYWNTFIIVFY